MSDFDDDLLALAEGTSKRKKSSSSKPNKRKRPESSDEGSASDMDMSESDSDAAPAAASPRGGKRGKKVKSAAQIDTSDEEDDEDDVPAPTEDNPYPLEGIYKDEADRRRISNLPELEREDIIGTRKDEMTERNMRKKIAHMAAGVGGSRKAQASSDAEEEDEGEEEGEHVSRSTSTRSRKTTGATSTKAAGIEKLKQSRAEKGKKKEKKADSDDDEDYEELASRAKKGKKRGSSSEAEEEESDDDRARKSKAKGKKVAAQPAGPDELGAIVLTRAKLAEVCAAPWFTEWVIGSWVRYSVGMDQQGQTNYRLCEVIGTKQADTYRFEHASTDILLELQHGKAKRYFSMDAVSNSLFTQREYARLNQTCQADDIPMPTSKEVAKIKEALAKHSAYIMTEEDLAKQLAKKSIRKSGAQLKAQLHMERTQAIAMNDTEKLASINERLANLDKPSTDSRETAAKLNERNRGRNREDVRKAEARSQEERRKMQEALAKGDTSVKVDASARVKTVPRMNYDSRVNSPLPGTPNNGSGRNTPVNAANANGTPKPGKAGKIESSVASRVQLDLDLDF
ncbi:hypothetical protein JCM11641_000705 [Rhodosporidiobolus odoratus]